MTTLPRLSLLAATALLTAAPAWAATVYQLPAATPAFETNNSFTASFAAAAGAGHVDFTVQGYATLDGDNNWIDILHVTLNGAEVFTATWDLGGGGVDRLLFPNGATVSAVADHKVAVSLPVTLAAGANQLVFTYSSPNTFEGIDRAGFQGLGDEGWGLNAVSVTSAVPEPTSGALLLGGLAGLGWLAKRRRS